MKRLILIVLILAFAVPSVQAREEGIDHYVPPTWATQNCINTVYKIVQHESGSTNDDEIFQFITEQIIRDIKIYGCTNLTQWRWRINNFPIERVSNRVRLSVQLVVIRYPKYLFPKCKFIGMKSDIKVWASYGYDTTIGFEKTVKGMTVVGVGCEYIYVSKTK